MKRWKDTPRRYVYREIWGLSAVMALRLIRSFRKCYPSLRAELDNERAYFAAALKRENNPVLQLTPEDTFAMTVNYLRKRINASAAPKTPGSTATPSEPAPPEA